MSSQLSFLDLLEAPPAFQFGPDLSPQQLRVRERGAGNQVVVAGAGTGKTETLTQRILKLLIEGDGQNGPVELSQILALTFTDKGAAEMRGRVYARLVQIIRTLPRGDLRSRLEALRSNFAENNRISTFDAFSFRILGQFPQHSPLDGEVEILDAAARGEMNRDITRRFWNRVEATFSDAQKMELWELLDVFPSRRAALLAMANLAEEETEADLRALSIVPPRDKWSEEFAALVARDGEKLWHEVENAVEKLEIPADLRAELLDASRVLAGGKSGIVTDKSWSAAFQKRWTPELIPGLERVGKRLRAWRFEAKIERDEVPDWKSRRAVAFLCGQGLWWQNAAREWCGLRGVASFAEIARAALEIVQHPEVAASLQNGFSSLLIDEFQDTNWRQWALLDALRDRETGNVLIVGDEKQAIFRFRGGDITVFDAVRRILLGEGQNADELTVSRRSTRQLVGWTNTVFRGVLPSDATRQSFEAPFQALQSETEFDGNGLWRLNPAQWHFEAENAVMLGETLPPIAIQRERAGRALARFLRALCDDGVLGQKSDAPDLQFPDLAEISRKIARGESAVGVIFTSHAVKTAFESQLRAFDVPFVSVRGSGFWSSEAATLSLHLLQILLDGSDKIAFVGLARSPLGGLSDVALLEWHLALNADAERAPGDSCGLIDGFSPSREDDARAFALLAARLESWRDLARVAPFSEVLEEVLDASELAFTQAGTPDGAQNEANWRKIVEMVREREQSGQGGLRSLIDGFSALIEEAQNGDKEAEAPLPGEASIQLMTVWAAKGLGFPLTVLAQLDDTPRAPGSLLLRGPLDGARQMAFGLSDDTEDDRAPKPWLWEKLRANDLAEEEAQWRRLFYVACTRAESHLMLICPEREVRGAAAWTNLCDGAQGEMREIPPVLGIPRASNGCKTGEIEAPPCAPAPPIERAAPREIALIEIAGLPAERFGAKSRAFVENRLEKLGGLPENARQDVPFSAPASVFGSESGQWLIGAWEWIAPLPGGAILLVASGMDGEIAARRAGLMRLAAENAGFEVRQCWAVWARGEETVGELVG